MKQIKTGLSVAAAAYAFAFLALHPTDANAYAETYPALGSCHSMDSDNGSGTYSVGWTTGFGYFESLSTGSSRYAYLYCGIHSNSSFATGGTPYPTVRVNGYKSGGVLSLMACAKSNADNNFAWCGAATDVAGAGSYVFSTNVADTSVWRSYTDYYAYVLAAAQPGSLGHRVYGVLVSN